MNWMHVTGAEKAWVVMGDGTALPVRVERREIWWVGSPERPAEGEECAGGGQLTAMETC